jgi:protein involved in polysaccharide export with SLBB domain
MRTMPIILTMLLSLALAACETTPATTPSTPPNLTAGGVPALQLGPGDRIQLVVYGVAELSGEYTIGDTGTVSIPLAGQVEVTNQTTAQIESTLARRLATRGLVQNPQVSVNVVKHRQVFVVGEVTRPGGFDYFSGMTVINAVALAGGYTVRASRSRVWVVRGGDGSRTAVQVNDNTFLLPGDTIQVPERWF